MRTKTLFLATAALAVGLATSMAQSNVYSVNIVGYINVPLGANAQTLLANPLDNGTNDLSSIGASLPNKSSASIWNGAGFTGTTKTAGAWGSNLAIAPGIGFFVKAPSASTLTFVGSAPTISTRALAGATSVMLGSMIPFSGALADSGTNTINLGSALPNKSTVSIWSGTAYIGTTKTAGAWGSNLAIGVAQGFFVKPSAASTWNQYLN